MFRNINLRLIAFITLIFFSAVITSGCAGGRHRVRLDAEDQFTKAKEKLDRRKFRDAIDLFEVMINQNRGSELIDDAHYYMGFAYYQIDDFIMSANEFDRLLNSYPSSNFADDAVYMKAMCYFKQSRGFGLDQDLTLQAIHAFQRYLDDFPLGDHIEEALKNHLECINRLARKEFETGKHYFRRGNLYSSYLSFRDILINFPDSDLVGPSLYYLGECYYKRNKFEEAGQYYLQTIDIVPESEWGIKSRDRLSEIRAMSSQAGPSATIIEKEISHQASGETTVEP
ncbi:outer membrane protein assembly factor BamD [candidate division KSB1 bacterium]